MTEEKYQHIDYRFPNDPDEALHQAGCITNTYLEWFLKFSGPAVSNWDQVFSQMMEHHSGHATYGKFCHSINQTQLRHEYSGSSDQKDIRPHREYIKHWDQDPGALDNLINRASGIMDVHERQQWELVSKCWKEFLDIYVFDADDGKNIGDTLRSVDHEIDDLLEDDAPDNPDSPTRHE